MIIREILADPAGELARFDFFNDYQDTRSWVAAHGPADVLAMLDAAHADWLRRHNEAMRATRVCPNCDRPAPGGLYATPPRGEGRYTVTHCGCYYEPKGGERFTDTNDARTGIRHSDPHED